MARSGLSPPGLWGELERFGGDLPPDGLVDSIGLDRWIHFRVSASYMLGDGASGGLSSSSCRPAPGRRATGETWPTKRPKLSVPIWMLLACRGGPCWFAPVRRSSSKYRRCRYVGSAGAGCSFTGDGSGEVRTGGASRSHWRVDATAFELKVDAYAPYRCGETAPPARRCGDASASGMFARA